MYKYKFDEKIKNQIRKLCVYNNFSAFIALFYDYLVIISAVILAQINFYFYPLTILLIGSRQRALATILHEASHKTLTKNRTLNKILGTYFSGYLIFQTFESYSKSHVINHHVSLGNENIDPDYQHYIKCGVFQDMTKKKFLFNFLFKPLLLLNTHKTFKYLIINRLFEVKHKFEYIKMLLSLAAFVSLGSFLIGWQFFFLYWLIPYLTIFQIITWFIELAEHYPLVKYAQYDLYASRNRFSHPIEAFFMSIHSENFHLIHHLFPGLPFWNMKKAHEILLEDAEYAKINAKCGGIFISSNYTKSKWHKITSNYQEVIN